MNGDIYTTSTAALKATIADIRLLNAKKININGKSIIGEISDLRGNNATPYDVWPNGVQDDGKGNIVVYPMGYNKISLDDITDEQYEKICSSAKIIDNVCYDNDDNIICYFETSSIKNTMGERISFLRNTTIDFSSDLSSLENGSDLFVNWTPRDTNGNLKDKNFVFDSLKICYNTFNNSHFNSLKIYAPILNDGSGMFKNMSAEKVFELNVPELESSSVMFEFVSCEDFFGKMNNIKNAENTFNACNIKNFKPDLSGLTSMDYMFKMCEIENFNADISNATSAVQAFENCVITNFNSNLDKLENGNGMFMDSVLENFNSLLPSLKSGLDMFNCYEMSAASFNNILHGLPVFEGEPNMETGEGYITITGFAPTDENAKLMYCDTWAEVEEEFAKKGWTLLQ